MAPFRLSLRDQCNCLLGPSTFLSPPHHPSESNPLALVASRGRLGGSSQSIACFHVSGTGKGAQHCDLERSSKAKSNKRCAFAFPKSSQFVESDAPFRR